MSFDCANTFQLKALHIRQAREDFHTASLR